MIRKKWKYIWQRVETVKEMQEGGPLGDAHG